ncbi:MULTISPECIES: hypothetical protein [unclassified Microcystis]|uniref:Uncharacterized protein n=1 Tax=Microcystis aeruginosa PCC 9443 TaxID=1160281 RepID=I4G580_MICAE|nr:MULTISPECIES: hypothetical protein [unclassified Microcystis]MCA2609455.1 hypothetical protein [Microcystis sp. M27BS1]CCI03091.1 hypothetical protein MICAC_4120008 [Microcystis aeruginosa PCC 9443]MCA2528570.1 hypothetical protein [Microcystis sp. M51BS1]MCA2542744.1 hypothetical protein [Microcystis sp. M55BS1]MCA2556623.1 hypothetical protein [Microcystis sp. M43BS1]
MGIFFWGKRLVQFYSSYFQLSVISYQLSVISDQLSVISYQCKYLSTINYTSKPLLRQTSAVVSKQRTENSNPIPNSCIPSPVSCLLSRLGN